MSNFLAGAKLDNKRYDDCMIELRKVGVNYDPVTIKRVKARIATVYPELEGCLLMAAIRLALLEWRTPAEREKELQKQAELMAVERARNAEKRERRQSEKEARVEYARTHGIAVEHVASHMMEMAIRSMSEAAEKAQQFDRLEEVLDTWLVDGVLLGDCTRPHLIGAASQTADRAALFRSLADVVAPGETVRASNRLPDLLRIIRDSLPQARLGVAA
jgi:acyl-CoA synthetase (NDP forming)